MTEKEYEEDKARNRLNAAWEIAALLVILTLAGLLIVQLVSHKHVRSYYLGGTRPGVATCIYADVDWMEDWVVYCTNDTDKAIQDVQHLNGK